VTSFVVVGAGWRGRGFWRLAESLDLTCVGAVVRSPRALEVPVFGSLEECLDTAQPDFVLTAVPWPATPRLVVDAVRRGVPVLAETPPAPDVPGLRALWDAVGESDLVQVAEQYPRLPTHSARASVVRSGCVGTPTQVQVSSTHQYHAVALMRAVLGVGFEPATVRAGRLTAPLVDPMDREGWTDDDTARPTTTTIATLDFGHGRSGVYDFTDNQWHNQLRFRRILVRGSRGELQDDRVVRLTGPRTITTSPLVRRQTGHDLDLEGFDTDHVSFDGEVVFRNPYPGRRWNDDEIAMASMLDAMAAWVRGDGPAPYPLADGLQDHLVALAAEEAAETGRAVTTRDDEPWSTRTSTHVAGAARYVD
jgi:predicted dehydrogenase